MNSEDELRLASLVRDRHEMERLLREANAIEEKADESIGAGSLRHRSLVEVLGAFRLLLAEKLEAA